MTFTPNKRIFVKVTEDDIQEGIRLNKSPFWIAFFKQYNLKPRGLIASSYGDFCLEGKDEYIYLRQSKRLRDTEFKFAFRDVMEKYKGFNFPTGKYAVTAIEPIKVN